MRITARDTVNIAVRTAPPIASFDAPGVSFAGGGIALIARILASHAVMPIADELMENQHGT